MLNQAATDRIELAKLLNISNEQLSYITNVEAGHGLLKVGSSLVPFENNFPKDTKLYRLMTTKVSDLHEDPDQRHKNSDNDPDESLTEPPKRAEFTRKLLEVARNNEDFEEIVDRYLELDQE